MARYQGQVATFRATVPLGGKTPAFAFEPRTVVDQYTVKKWKDLGLAPSDLCTDSEFIRRLSLDLTGTLPTPAEARFSPILRQRPRLGDGIRPIRRRRRRPSPPGSRRRWLSRPPRAVIGAAGREADGGILLLEPANSRPRSAGALTWETAVDRPRMGRSRRSRTPAVPSRKVGDDDELRPATPQPDPARRPHPRPHPRPLPGGEPPGRSALGVISESSDAGRSHRRLGRHGAAEGGAKAACSLR